jgi:hypothetical protein
MEQVQQFALVFDHSNLVVLRKQLHCQLSAGSSAA